MTPTCEMLERFADGELGAPDADRFRDHLATCADCQRGLHDLMQLDRLAHEARPAQPARAASRWTNVGIASAMAATFALALLVVRPAAFFGPADDGLLASLGDTRAVEGRLSLVSARGYHAYDVARNSAAPRSVPLAILARLEAKGAHREIASIYLAAGDLDRASEHLDRAVPGPGVDSDRAVIALARGRAGDAVPLLERALDAEPSDAAARWNRALALSRLGLDVTAIAAFEAIAATGESGWSEEAAARARALREAVDRRRLSVEEAQRATDAMAATGAVLPAAVMRAHPDLVRRAFYEAVRAAPDAARLDALEPVAAGLDDVAGGSRMRDRLASARRLDLARRRDAAIAYGAILSGATSVSPAERGTVLARFRSAGDPDLLLGALYALGPFPARETAELVRLAEATGDPWFLLLAAQEDAARLRGEGRVLDAEARLLAVESLCTTADRSLDLRCALRDHFLAEDYAALHRVDEARLRAAAERERVTRAQDWRQEGAVIPLEGVIALLDGGYALARAYLEETSARRPGDCAVERFVHLALAQAAQNERRPERARAELDAAPRCDEPVSAAALNVAADLARFDGTPERVSRVREDIAGLRKAPGSTKADLARLDFFEGRLLSASDPAAAELFLRQAVAQSDAGAGDPVAGKTRGYAYSSLSVLASARGDHAAVVRLLAEEARVVPLPTRCALAVNVDDERTVTAVLGADGAATGVFQARRAPGPVAAGTIVTPALVQALRGCDQIVVFARPPLQGRAELLPPGTAFSFRDGSAGSRGSTSASRVVIAASDPPAALRLPRLSGAGPALPGELRVEGSAATPDRALAAMSGAGEVVIHAHGRVDLAVSGASHLVLSPDRDGRFALTADDIAKHSLAGRPVVVLAACHAAEPATHVHEPWSLPAAFLRAGARAVIASTDPIPDRDSAAFFDAILDEIRRGTPPAIALEKVRAAERSRAPVTAGTRAWYENVVVFE